ncbi:hypothetical protein NQZ68_017304 [Dissostichus eleginoides]|nr:hypothetical protein NQZ68_017304 [Dissostichus eleginoides]
MGRKNLVIPSLTIEPAHSHKANKELLEEKGGVELKRWTDYMGSGRSYSCLTEEPVSERLQRDGQADYSAPPIGVIVAVLLLHCVPVWQLGPIYCTQ